MAKALTYEELLGKMEKVARTTPNKMAIVIAEIEKKHVQEDVYDYYDEIRSGHNVVNPYKRTGKLVDGIKVKRSRNQAFVIHTGYDDNTLERIESGETNWKNSVLYKLSPSQRMRPFMENTIIEVDSIVDSFTLEEFKKNNMRITRR